MDWNNYRLNSRLCHGSKPRLGLGAVLEQVVFQRIFSWTTYRAPIGGGRTGGETPRGGGGEDRRRGEQGEGRGRGAVF